MEPKDLNEFINQKLDQGSGLRYKEEYWTDMNSLLDANMPVEKQEAAATTGDVQTSAKNSNWSYLISACVATVAAIVMCFQLSTAPTVAPTAVSTAVETDNSYTNQDKNTPVTTQTTSPVASSNASSSTESAHSNKINEQTSEPAVENNKAQQPLDHSIITGTSTQQVDHKPSSDLSTTENSISAPSKPQTTESSSSSSSYNPPSDQTGSNESFVPEQRDQQQSTHSTELILIEPMGSSGKINELTLATVPQTVSHPRPERNRLIQGISLTPFAGMIVETGTQTYQSGSIVYAHPTQSHFTYGINIECTLKQFALRTGIGLSSTTLESTLTTDKNIYDVDTHYVIVNAHYGTTRSGRPVALVQRQLDSALVSTQHTTVNANTTYQYLTIPLTIQYHMAYKRFLLVLEGGGLHQIRISQQTNQPIQTENYVPLPVYSFQLTAGSGIRYALSSQWAAGVQYNYILNPSSANLHFLNNAHAAILTLTYSIRRK